MKKLFLIALALVVALSMGVTVFAATETLELVDVEEQTSDEDVVVKVLDKDGNVIGDADDSDDDGEEDITRVYSVDVAWDSLVFEYQLTVAEEDLVWNPDTHSYTVLDEESGEYVSLEEAGVGAWNDNSRDVVVTNHSNASVGVAVAFTNGTKTADAVHNVTATVDGADTTLDSAVGTEVDAAPSVTYEVSVDGEPAQFAEFTVDTLTVTISK